jgi:hypothetical protein
MSRIDQPFVPSECRFVRQLNSNNDGSTFGIFRSARGHDRIFSDVTKGDLLFLAPTYTFATPVFGGQFAVGVTSIFGRSAADINGTLTTSVGPFATTRAGLSGREGLWRIRRGPSGWNTWLTFQISPEAPTAVTPTKHLVTK